MIKEIAIDTGLRKITEKELWRSLEEHALWLDSGYEIGGDAEFLCCDLSQLDMEEAKLSNASFFGSHLEGVRAPKVMLQNSNLCHVNLRGADLRGANLQGALLIHSDLSNVDFRGADLRGADLRGTCLEGTQFSRAHLHGAKIDQETMKKSLWEHGDLPWWKEQGGLYVESDRYLPAKEATSFVFSPVNLAAFEHLSLKKFLSEGKIGVGWTAQDQIQLLREADLLKNASEPQKGDVLAGARLGEKLSEGLWGTLWLGERVGDGTSCAVKQFRREFFSHNLAVHHFRKNILLMQQFSEWSEKYSSLYTEHTKIYEIEEDHLSFSMELISGEDLLRDRSHIGAPLIRKLALFRLFSEGIEALHQKGLSHGNIKPQNIIMRGERPVITDYCYADPWSVRELYHQSRPSELLYVAPELLQKQHSHPEMSSDIYSLGRLLHFLLLESHPPKLIGKSLSFREMSHYPKGLVRILRKSTHFEAGQRYQCVSEFLSELKHYEEAELVGVHSVELDAFRVPAEQAAFIRKNGRGKEPSKNGFVIALILLCTCLAFGFLVKGQYQKAQKAKQSFKDIEKTRQTFVSGVNDWERMYKGDREATQRYLVGLLSKTDGRVACRVLSFLSKKVPLVEAEGGSGQSYRAVRWIIEHYSGKKKPFRFEKLNCDKETSLRAVDLKGLSFLSAKMMGVDFERAFLNGANFYEARLSRSHFFHAKLKGSLFGFADLSRADFRYAELGEASLNGANLTGVNFRGADLKNADLRGSHLDAASFFEADLRGSDLRGALLKGTDFKKALLHQSFFYASDLTLLKKFRPDGAACFSVNPFFGADFALKCYQWHRNRKKKHFNHPPIHCPKNLDGPIIAYPLHALKVQGVCPWSSR